MTVLYNKFPGSIHICSNCGALLKYTTQDIYENCYIYCPLCKSREKCAMDLSYDGVIKNGTTTGER